MHVTNSATPVPLESSAQISFDVDGNPDVSAGGGVLVDDIVDVEVAGRAVALGEIIFGHLRDLPAAGHARYSDYKSCLTVPAPSQVQSALPSPSRARARRAALSLSALPRTATP